MIEVGTVDGGKHDPEGLQSPHEISGLERTQGPFVCMHAYMPIAVLHPGGVSLSPGRCSSNIFVSTSIPKKVSAVDGPWVLCAATGTPSCASV